jgi:hypothetical protein
MRQHETCKPLNFLAFPGVEPFCETAWYAVKQRSGAGERSRTPDLLITNELLYQLSYTGEGRSIAGLAASLSQNHRD